MSVKAKQLAEKLRKRAIETGRFTRVSPSVQRQWVRFGGNDRTPSYVFAVTRDEDWEGEPIVDRRAWIHVTDKLDVVPMVEGNYVYATVYPSKFNVDELMKALGTL